MFFADTNPGKTPPPPGKNPAGAPGAAAPVEELEEVEEEHESEVGAVLVDMMPWAISTLVHVALVLLAIWAVWWQIKKVPEEEIIIPSAKLSEKPGAPLSMKTTKKLQKTTTKRRSVTKQPTTTPTNVASKVKTKTRLIGVVGGSAGKSSPFGAVFGAEGPFQSSLYGNGGNAKRIAYLIDASGSLIDTLPFVVMELKRSINALSEKQSFTVIFFQQDKAIEVPPYGLKQASPRMKRTAMQWIDPRSGHVVPHGQSNPLTAIKRALRYRPQLVYVLSDNITGAGRWEMDQRTLLSEVRKANVAGTKINTIQFLYDDPLVNIGMGRTLEKISNATGGRFKFVDARALGLD
jgi:hypothetical protein